MMEIILRWSVVLLVVVWRARCAENILKVIQDLESLITPGPEYPDSAPLKDGQKFDYIVVGAGAAGSAAAFRLASAGACVLLVEAGGNPTALTKVPLLSTFLLGSSVDWQYETIGNNVSCLLMRGQQCRFSRGKCLGGSTSINYMMYVRGNRRDYDDLGIPGWSWKDVEPYFLRYEGLRDLDKLPASSAPYHNTSGILQVEFFADSGNQLHPKLIEGFQSLNFPFNADVNAESQIGVSQVLGYVYNGERESTARAYLAHLTKKDLDGKLIVAKNTRCIKVNLDEDNVARGVSVVTALGRKLNIVAKREVVLSAGTIGTAQILMLSGIGPADHLRQIGISVRVNSTVGDDMSDHVLPLIFISVDDESSNLLSDLLNVGLGSAQIAEWLTTRRGPFGSNGLTDVTAFVNTSCYDFEKKRLTGDVAGCELPTSQMIFSFLEKSLITLAKPVLGQFTGFGDELVDQLAEANAKRALIITSSVVLRPRSLGRVRLASPDPLAAPAIFPNYLSEESDVEEMVRAILILEDLVQTEPFRAVGARVLRLRLAGCPSARYEADRRGYWACYVRHVTYSVFHAVGTCALGRVVGPELDVLGARGLRVADISVLPQMVRGNTAASAIAIGERLADFLLRNVSFVKKRQRRRKVTIL